MIVFHFILGLRLEVDDTIYLEGEEEDGTGEDDDGGMDLNLLLGGDDYSSEALDEFGDFFPSQSNEPPPNDDDDDNERGKLNVTQETQDILDNVDDLVNTADDAVDNVYALLGSSTDSVNDKTEAPNGAEDNSISAKDVNNGTPERIHTLQLGLDSEAQGGVAGGPPNTPIGKLGSMFGRGMNAVKSAIRTSLTPTPQASNKRPFSFDVDMAPRVLNKGTPQAIDGGTPSDQRMSVLPPFEPTAEETKEDIDSTDDALETLHEETPPEAERTASRAPPDPTHAGPTPNLVNATPPTFAVHHSIPSQVAGEGDDDNMSILTEAPDDISIATSYCTVGTRKSKRNRGKKIEYNKEQIFE